ncbi:trypsin Blo t 3-like [Diprion similis]|uniref:trypsin Blo t 3-like n=1 Tax=Diprion similis TaxID=362088 RepID=UPI001EF86D99|nr:trypsin Blo t 3-like [Diprion similis]
MIMKVNIILTVLTCVCRSVCQGLESKEMSENDTNIESSRRILFGQEVNPMDFPYFVLLRENTEGWFCGGSIITNQWILTAAHCLSSVTCNMVKVLPPALLANSEFRIHADECHGHEQYVPSSSKFDIALIKVKEDLLQDAKAKTISLPVPGNVLYPPETSALLLGWGKNENNQRPGHLVSAYAPIVDWETCNRNFKSYQASCESTATCKASDIPARSLCTQGVGDSPTGICLGDSGGPVVVDGVLAGISTLVLAFKDGGCQIGAPSVYTNVADYLPWIYSFTDPTKDTTNFITRDESPK